MPSKKSQISNISAKNTNIPVVILCGGWGTRLKEETEIIPKPLVYVGNRPILWHIMKIYSSYGFSNFILPIGYKGDKIKEYFLNYSALEGDFTVDFSGEDKKVIPHSPILEKWKITIVDTGLYAETGARIKRIEPYIKSDTFLLTYGEIAGQTVFHCHVHVFPRYPDDPYVGFRTILKGAIFELSSLQK